MQLDQDWVQAQGEDAMLLHFVDTAFLHAAKKRVVAVSGGGDSMALLHLSHRVAVQTGTALFAVTVDHKLRDESADEAAFVADYCATLGVPHEILPWDHDGVAGNISAQARDARYRLIAAWCRRNKVSQVLLGHTMDDQAENFIMRLARKSGPDGLASMEPQFKRNKVQWARPLWQQSRAELRAYLKRHSVAWVDDPTNDDTQYERVRVRKALDVLAPLGIDAETLHSVSFSMRMTSAALETYTAREAEKYVIQDRGDLILEIGQRDNVPPEIMRRLWSGMIHWASQSEYPPRARSLFDATYRLQPDGQTTIGGCIVTRKGDVWRITREHNAVRALTCGTSQIWDNRWQLSGPHAPDLHIGPLGEAVKDCPDWRDTGLPRTSLLASPAVWQGETLIAAPLAGYNPDWTAQIVADFHSSLLTH